MSVPFLIVASSDNELLLLFPSACFCLHVSVHIREFGTEWSTMDLSCECFVCLLLIIESPVVSGRMHSGENMASGTRLTGFEPRRHPF